MHSITTVPHEMNAASASVVMDLKNVGAVLVEREKEVVGILTERDILRKVVARCQDPANTKVGDIMNSPVIMIDEKEDVEKASAVMRDKNIRRLVVTNDGKITGILTTRSISNNLKFV